MKKLKAAFHWVAIRLDVPDRFVFIGIGLVAGGLWSIFPPLAPLFIGVAFIVLGVLGARK